MFKINYNLSRSKSSLLILFTIIMIMIVLFTPIQVKYIILTIISFLVAINIIVLDEHSHRLIKLDIKSIVTLHVFTLILYIVLNFPIHYIRLISNTNNLTLFQYLALINSITLYVLFPGLYVHIITKRDLSISILYGFTWNSFILFLSNIIRYKLMLDISYLILLFLLLNIIYLLFIILYITKKSLLNIKMNIILNMKIILISMLYLILLVDFILNMKPLLFGDHWYGFGWSNYVVNNRPNEYAIDFMIYPWGYPFYASALTIVLGGSIIPLVNAFAWLSVLNIILLIATYVFINMIFKKILKITYYDTSLGLALIFLSGGIGGILLFPYIINMKLQFKMLQATSEYTADIWWSTHNPIRYIHLSYTVGLMFALSMAAALIYIINFENKKQFTKLEIPQKLSFDILTQAIMFTLAFLIHLIDPIIIIILLYFLTLNNRKLFKSLFKITLFKLIPLSFLLTMLLDSTFNFKTFSFFISRVQLIYKILNFSNNNYYIIIIIISFFTLFIFLILKYNYVKKLSINTASLYYFIRILFVVLVISSFILWIAIPKYYYYYIYIGLNNPYYWRLGLPLYFLVSSIGFWLIAVSFYSLLKSHNINSLALVSLLTILASLLIIGKRLLIFSIIFIAILSAYIVPKTKRKSRYILLIYILILVFSLVSGSLLHQRLILDPTLSKHSISSSEIEAINYIINNIQRDANIVTFDEALSWKVSIFTSNPTFPKPRPTMYFFKPYGEYYDRPLWISLALTNMNNMYDFLALLLCNNIQYIYIDMNKLKRYSNLNENIEMLRITGLVTEIFRSNNIILYKINNFIQPIDINENICYSNRVFNLILIDNEIKFINAKIDINSKNLFCKYGEIHYFSNESTITCYHYKNENYTLIPATSTGSHNNTEIILLSKQVFFNYGKFNVDTKLDMNKSILQVSINKINLYDKLNQYNIIVVITWNKKNSMIFVIRVDPNKIEYIDFNFDLITKKSMVYGKGIVFYRYDNTHSREYDNMNEVKDIEIKILIYKIINGKHQKIAKIRVTEINDKILEFIRKYSYQEKQSNLYTVYHLKEPFTINISAEELILPSSFGEVRYKHDVILPHGNILHLFNSNLSMQFLYSNTEMSLVKIDLIHIESLTLKNIYQRQNIVIDERLILIYFIGKNIVFIISICIFLIIITLFLSLLKNLKTHESCLLHSSEKA